MTENQRARQLLIVGRGIHAAYTKCGEALRALRDLQGVSDTSELQRQLRTAEDALMEAMTSQQVLLGARLD